MIQGLDCLLYQQAFCPHSYNAWWVLRVCNIQHVEMTLNMTCAKQHTGAHEPSHNFRRPYIFDGGCQTAPFAFFHRLVGWLCSPPVFSFENFFFFNPKPLFAPPSFSWDTFRPLGLKHGTECLGDCPDAAYYGPYIQEETDKCCFLPMKLL